MPVPRGIRNNNPLNIRIGNTWLGERPNPTDPAFEEFVSMEYGIRAAFLILRRYIRRYGKNTVRSIVSTWAPATENATRLYIDTVCSMTGIAHDEVIRFEDKQQMCLLVESMIFFECGQRVPRSIIEKAYDIS